MQERNLDIDFINTIKGSQISRGLSDLEIQLALIQAACAMALQGVTRATATEITNKAIAEYEIEATASFTGQTFANLNIRTATSHGKSRFILEYDHLERLRQDIAAKCEELNAKLESSIVGFHDLPERVNNLQTQWQDIVKMRNRERELINFINEANKAPPRLNQLEAVARQMRGQADQVQELEKECRNLSNRIKKLPSLEERKKSLEAAIGEHEKAIADKEQQLAAKEKKLVAREKEIAGEERELTFRESQLSERISKLHKRTGWVDLATVDQAIESAREELKQISRQLGEKRSLLDRLLHRKEGGAS